MSHFMSYAGHFYGICASSAQRLRRWSSGVQVSWKCFVFTWTTSTPASAGHWPIDGSALDYRLRRCPSFDPGIGGCLVLPGGQTRHIGQVLG